MLCTICIFVLFVFLDRHRQLENKQKNINRKYHKYKNTNKQTIQTKNTKYTNKKYKQKNTIMQTTKTKQKYKYI